MALETPDGDAEKGPDPRDVGDTDTSSLPGDEEGEKQEEDAGRTSIETTGPGYDDAAGADGTSRRDEGSVSNADADGAGVLSRIAGRVLTRQSTKSSWNAGPPPDGGVKAWTAGESPCPVSS